MSNEREDISIPVIISKLQLLEVERELLMGYAMMFHKTLLGIAPEALQPVDVHPATGEVRAVIDPQVPIAAEHQGVIDPEAVGVYDTAAAHLLDGQPQDGLGAHVWDRLDTDPSLPLQDTENRNFSGGAPTSLAFASASEVSFIEFDFASQEHISIAGMCQDRRPNGIDSLQGGVVGQAHLLGALAGREFQFEEFDDPQPLVGGQPPSINPAPGKVLEGVATACTSSPVVFEEIELSCPAAGQNR